jgi:enamine deaminase RidA (YjgF/YER057c/UK114 family)
MATSFLSAPSGRGAHVPKRPNHFYALQNSAPDPFLSCRLNGRSICLNLRPKPREGILDLLERLGDALQDATILGMMVFGSAGAAKTGREAMRQVLGKVDWPVTWVEGGASDGNPIAGMQVTALPNGAVQRLVHQGQVVGSVFQDGAARHCLIGGLGPDNGGLARAAQTSQTLEQLELVLGEAGFTLADTVRTWFFLEDLLSWYGEFNQARTQVYSGVRFRTGSLPASTGVGARNPAGAALSIAAHAMQPLLETTRAFEVASPLQCPAPAYGSSFSRAMEISTGDSRLLYISGTASIAPGGATLWLNDIHRQVDLTMKVVEAILTSRGFTLANLLRAVAYFKHPQDVPVFTKWCVENKLGSLPVVLAHCDVCRDDLLFELEADAGGFTKFDGSITRL